jgi:mycothione reductase
VSASTSTRHHDLVIIGAGSGNSIPGPEFDDLDIAIVERGKFGGTCLNVGCVPTKMFVHPADLAAGARAGAALGVKMSIDAVHWAALRDRVFARIDPIVAEGKAYREGPRSPNVTVYTGTARFVGHKRLDTGTGTVITADRWVLAAGSRATVPDIPGLALGPRVHTSDTIMFLDDLPRSVLVFGGGDVAAEFAHVFGAFGSDVTLVIRGDRLLRTRDRDISEAFTAAARRQWTLHSGLEPTSFAPGQSDVVVDVGGRRIVADVVLVATGRVPNSDLLDVAATGVAVDAASGLVTVDEYQRTSVDGIFALGDISSPWELKHVANHEMRVVRHNLAHPDAMIRSDHRFVPSAVFTDPQVAGVGLSEAQALESGREYVASRYDYAGIAAGWAREDTTGFVKVLADPRTGLLIGAHVIGPEAATVIQPLIQAMAFGQTAHDVATKQYWIHPSLSEVVENALLTLPAPTGRPPR